MVRTGIAELKAQLSRFLRITRSGEEVVITDRGRPVARLVPVQDRGGERPVHLVEMESRGEIRIGTGQSPETTRSLPRPAIRRGLLEPRRGPATSLCSAVQALLDERSEGR